jgi:putative transcriptional regulator
LLREWLDLSGASIFEGKKGFDQLWRFLVETAEKNPGEILVNVKPSDDGVHVCFADNAQALIPFRSMRRIAEADDIHWDSIRIAGQRTFITLSTSGGEDIPIPHDVLREFVVEEAPKRKVGYVRERKLTAQYVGDMLKAAREKHGITQETLASRVDSSRWTIMRIEKGDYVPKVVLLAKLARALEMRVEELLASQ